MDSASQHRFPTSQPLIIAGGSALRYCFQHYR